MADNSISAPTAPLINGSFVPADAPVNGNSPSADSSAHADGVPHGVSHPNGDLQDPHFRSLNNSNNSLLSYEFRSAKLKPILKDPSKTPLCLIACGSFSPITYLHLRMFEMVADYTRRAQSRFEFIGGYFSPVGDAYKKVGLAPAEHRIRMCELAVQGSERLDVDSWEGLQSEYQPTALVLDHFDHELNVVRGGVKTPDGGKRRIHIALLAGADLIETMSTPNVWSEEDLDHILGQYGSFIIERSGTDMDEALRGLSRWRSNIWVIKQLIKNDVSSTKIRKFLSSDMSVSYLVPALVVQYISENGLYVGEKDGKGSLESLLASQNSHQGEEEKKGDEVAVNGGR